MTRINKPYYELMKAAITCPECGWSGTGKELAVGEVYDESAIIEYVCPKCGFDIALTAGPTIEESRANWADVSDADRAYVELVADRRAAQGLD